MTEYKTENKLGVGEILICNKDTKGKLEPLKYFIGKVIINLGGGGEKIYVIEEKEKVFSEVKSIQSRGNFKAMMMTGTESKFKSQEHMTHSLRDGNKMNNNEINMEEEGRKSGSSIKIQSGNVKYSTKNLIDVANINQNGEMHDINELDEMNENMEEITNPNMEKDKPINNGTERISEKGTLGRFSNKSAKFDDMKIPEDDEFNLKKSTVSIHDKEIKNGDEPEKEISPIIKNSTRSRFDTQMKNEENVANKNFVNDKNMSDVSYNTKYTNEFSPNKTMGFSDKEQQIVQIVKGKYHLLKLTMDGKVYGSGQAYFGVVGLGGNMSSDKPKLLPNLANIKIVQISCGMFHSLALSQSGDLYVWGMGFEGQLGLSSKYKVASSPRYLNFFYRKSVKFITCGHNYSLCITNDSRLWGWGENKLGQLGLGKIQIVEKPTQIELFDLPGNQEGCSKADSFINGNYERPYTSKPLSACYVSAGFSHTAVVTDEGFLLTFGLNIYGQLGLGNTTSTFEPRLIEKDDNADYIGRVVKVSCNTTGTFIITEEGTLYSCGSGSIGHGDIGVVVKLPRKISDSRVYQHVFCNENSIVAFCPLRILSISPASGPAAGNTILSIIGSALKEFPKLSVRFIFGGIARDVKATFDKVSKTIFVRTPNFIELCPSLELPNQCKVQLTFDGHYFTEYKDAFLIYPSNIKTTGIEPKCGPTKGGYELSVKINLDNIPSQYLFSLTCGFQAKPPIVDTNINKKIKSKRINNSFTNNVIKTNETLEESKLSIEDKSIGGKDKDALHGNNININPMDFVTIEAQLEKANWYCCFATYENGIMKCKIPKIDHFSQNQVEYNVDVAVNGQQFSGFPMIYRFYEIEIDRMEPNISPLEGGLQMKIYGSGLFDSVTKKAKITSKLGERYSDLQWDRSDKSLILVSNPIYWITNDEDAIKNISPSELFEDFSFDVEITMNNIQWINVGSYRYCDPRVTRIVYHTFPENVSKDDRLISLSTPEQITNEERIILGLIPYPDDKKKKDEIEKKRNEEDNIMNNIYKRPYNGLILYGNFFPNTQHLKVKLVAQNCEQEVIAFYKNRYKIACLIPEIHKLPVGQYELKVMISVNSQLYYPANGRILFNSPEFGLSFEDIVKLDELEAKGGKKGATGQKNSTVKK